eukprot:symbB.v1.2.022338.t1/scaffold1934.1/size95668/4
MDALSLTTTFRRSPPSTWSCASVVVIARHCQISKLAVGLGLGMLFFQVPCGIFDDPKLVADVKEAVATIKKAMVQIGELSANMTPLNINQMTRWVNTKEEHAGKIVSLMSEYCLCQRVKPPSDPKSPFTSDADYISALQAHHAVMLSAVKCKQNVDPALADALDASVADMSKMYMK